jgi:hypothetical protein
LMFSFDRSWSVSMRLTFLGSLILLVVSTPALPQTKSAPTEAPKSLATASKMKPGVWEVTTVSKSAGSTGTRTVTARACLTAEDTGNLQRIVPQQREFGMKCETRDAKAQGPDATWRVTCTGKDGSLNGTGKMTFAADAYAGHAELERKSPGAKAVKVEQTVTGKWIDGNCK